MKFLLVFLLLSIQLQAKPLPVKEEIQTMALNSMLLSAVEKGSLEAVNSLLNRGANPNYRSENLSAVYLATVYQHIDTLTLLLKHKANVPNEAIEFVAVNGPLEIAELFAANEISFNQLNQDGDSLLVGAIRTNNVQMVGFLIEQGVNPNIKNNNGQDAFEANLYYLESQQKIRTLLNK